MAKILLVEDDNNLREIYEARLMAEGYTIVAAPDGEAALAVASKEKPDLVISDVMMPNISGFDMLDIMRNTPETANIKVIMLTALSQAEDEARAESLGADRYLVKSQVTLEDIVNNAKVLLGDAPAEDTPAPAPTAPVATTVVDTPVAAAPDDSALAATPAQPTTIPVASDDSAAPTTPPASDNVAGSEPIAKEEQAIQSQIDTFANQPVPAEPSASAKNNDALLTDAVNTLEASVPASESPIEAPAAPAPVAPVITPAASAAPETDMPDVTIAPLHDSTGGTKIIEPIDGDGGNIRPDINTLLAAEEAKEQANGVTTVGPKPEDIAL